MANCLCPLDGRYAEDTEILRPYFSESALFRYRLRVEVEYLLYLVNFLRVETLSEDEFKLVRLCYHGFDDDDYRLIKFHEAKVHHDVKALEYMFVEYLKDFQLEKLCPWVHFGLTSQDINNTAVPLMLREACKYVMFPELDKLKCCLSEIATGCRSFPMLALTHGQPASPTTLGKELKVFVMRLQSQLKVLMKVPFAAKFGGATGNFNAHYVAYPDVDWSDFADRFVSGLCLVRTDRTTQIEPYDRLAELCHAFCRVNTLLLDLCQDLWLYVSRGYFVLRLGALEVGSSTMPHKMNPIWFEKAEGNLGLSTALFQHMASKLPVSRLQRDLSDSTVLRNLGMPLGYALVAYRSIVQGLKRLAVNREALRKDLDDHWEVLTEAVQTVLRRERVHGAYNLLKDWVQSNRNGVTQSSLAVFIESLDVRESVKRELLSLTPENYVGDAARLSSTSRVLSSSEPVVSSPVV